MSAKRLWPTPTGSDARSEGRIGQMRQLVEDGVLSRAEAEAAIGGSLEPARMKEWAPRKDSPQSTFLQGDSPVSRSLLPGSEAAHQTTVSSGLRCCALLRSSSPVGCLLRTLLESSTWHSTTCYLTWKASVTKSSRLLFQLAPSTPRTEGTGCGLWRTPTSAETHNQDFSTQVYLQNQVKLWPTPLEDDSSNNGGPSRTRQYEQGKRKALNVAVKMWPTPTTPRPHDNESTAGKYMPSQNQKDLAAVVAPTGGQLNPNFVEFLMNYPKDWTRID